MFWGKWNVRKRPDLTWDLKVHAFRENVLGNIDEKVEDVNLDDLWKHIFELGKLREEGNHKQARSLGHFPWPNVFDLQNLKGYVLLRSDLPIDGDVKEILWRVNVATVAPLVVAHALEILDASITNREELWHLTEVMYDLAIALKTLSESPEGTQDVMQEATSLIVEGARMFYLRSDCRRSASEGNEIIQKLNTMYMYINTEFTVSAFTPIQHQRRCHLSKQYPTQPGIEALLAATNNFHEDNKVGEGGFGAVYKGTTDDGKQIAVKKMSFTNERSREFMTKQFDNEKLLAEVQHLNLVNLLGYCEQGSERFLVYEYLPNESLDKFLSDPEKRKRLGWYKRYNIIEGIVCGLCYLHEYSQRRIVHRDIKTSNILLDETLSPKIADFGTANLFPEDRTHVTATTRVGTRGYMPPEYAMEGKITVKVDVYSFGVVLFELLTGKLILNNATEYLEWVWSSYNQNKVADTIDRTITETWDKEKGKAKAKAKALALRCFQVALLCIQNEATLRPTMLQVKMMLSSSQSLPVPTKPPLVSSSRRSCF